MDGTESLYEPITVDVAMNTPLTVTAYPNPVRTRGTVEVQVEDPTETTVELYNLLGQRMETLYDGTLRPGAPTRLRLRADDLPSGTYFVRVRTPAGTETRRVSVVR